MTNGDSEPPNSSSLSAEVERLQEENARLRSLLIAHGIPISEVPASRSETIQVSSSAPEVQRPGVATAEQRIALFRSLFRGREDVYAIRWENSDGRSGYMPKADRDWKSYLERERAGPKKVDRQTRSYRPLTDEYCVDILLVIRRLGSIRFCRMSLAGFWRLISTKRHGRRIQQRFSLSATNSTYRRHWNARDLGRVAMCGSSLNERYPPQPLANSAV